MAEPRNIAILRWVGLGLGPALALLVYGLLPGEQLDVHGEAVALSGAARALAAVGVLMGVWWISEALPLEATALLPLALFPALGITTIKAAAAPYADPVIFLFMGGLILGLSMERWGLHRRVALRVMAVTGTRPVMLVAGIMAATALMSMWVSNTATAVMMLPIGMSIAGLIEDRCGPEGAGMARRFGTCLMLSIAYASSIGGVGTLVGTPPNAVLAGIARNRGLVPELSFARWMLVGVPTLVVFLPIAWVILARVLYRIPAARVPGLQGAIAGMLRDLGPMKRGEWVTFLVFCCTALAWIVREPLVKHFGLYIDPGNPDSALLTDAGIAMIAALALFLIPVSVRERTFTMDWEHAAQLPWGVLILFGGGLTLAGAMSSTGLDKYIAAAVKVHGLHPLLMVLLLTAAMVFLTEFASNTAVATTFLPLAYVLAGQAGVHPYALMIPLTIASSYAFMMPMGTPPNALVFASGYVNIRQMTGAGLLLNISAIVVISLLSYWLAPAVMGFAIRP